MTLIHSDVSIRDMKNKCLTVYHACYKEKEYTGDSVHDLEKQN